jgi:DNA-binding IclR family transcriptional regulator
LLKQIGVHHTAGVRLVDLVETSGLDKSTIHRLLQCLAEEGLIERLPDSKRYRLGIESIQLGLQASNMEPLVTRFRPLMHRVARISEDTVFLIVRSGDYSVYIDRIDGVNLVKEFAIGKPGQRRLLGFSMAGLCMLAKDEDSSIHAMYKRHEQAYQQRGITLPILRRYIHSVRKDGYYKMDDFGPTSAAGVGYGFELSSTLEAGVSIASVKSRMSTERIDQLALLLQRELAAMEYRKE